MDENLISGLIRKRQDLAIRLETAQAEVHQTLIDIDHIDATLRLLDPKIELLKIKPKRLPPKYAAFDAEIVPIVLDILRQSERSLTTRDLAIRIAQTNGVSITDPIMVRTIARRVGAALRHQRNRGVVRNIKTDGTFLRWEINR